jgi:bestrophin-1
MTEKERVCFEAVESPHPKFWIPCMWCSTLVSRAREEGKITDDINLKTILDVSNHAVLENLYWQF